MEQSPKVGLGIFLFKDGKVLMGKRLSKHGYGYFATPGGHLELGESFEECAKREALEETNLTITKAHFVDATNVIFTDNNAHYVTCYVIAKEFEGQLKNLEPDKCLSWDWYDLDNLPTPILPSLEILFRKTSIRTLYSYLFPKKPVAYLASPYAHKDESIKLYRQQAVTKAAARLQENGHFVFSPLTHNIPLIEEGITNSWDTWKSYDLSMLLKCDALYVLKLEGWETSQGVQEEIKAAKEIGLPIYELDYVDEKIDLTQLLNASALVKT